MSQLLRDHTEYELREQRIAERYWPTGERAENLRAEMIGHMVANSVAFDQKRSRRIETIWQMLNGTYEPDAAQKQGVTKEQIKAGLGMKQ